MATGIPTKSVWSAMNYVPPRGRCNFKAGVMYPTCTCLRFMLHPTKAATSFECDGCNHHSSFHMLENKEEVATLKKWATEQKLLDDEKRETKRLKMATAENGTRKAITAGPGARGRGAQNMELRIVEIVDGQGNDEEEDAEGMLQRTMALFAPGDSDGGAALESEPERQPRAAPRPKKGKKK